MDPIRIGSYCFDRIHLWIQYDRRIASFVEVVIELYYPAARDADGLVMFSHGFLIGNDLLFYPKKIAGALLGDNPLFGIHPSRYYNYTSAVMEHNWALAFVSSTHLNAEWVGWTDIGGNPRVGQEAYAAASYLVKYGSTDAFYRADEHNRGRSFFDPGLLDRSRFLKPGCNRVLFAGHSVGGAHAQAAACGFEALSALGSRSCKPFDPVLFDREFLPACSERMSAWKPEERAMPVGLLMLSPVDQQVPLLAPGMQAYREHLSSQPMPMVMLVGECDCAALDASRSTPPAWSAEGTGVTQFSQIAPEASSSWAVAASVEKGSHAGYLGEKSWLCSLADSEESCSRCPGVKKWREGEEQYRFSEALLGRMLADYGAGGPYSGDFCNWLDSGAPSWLNRKEPFGGISLQPRGNGSFIDYAGKGSRCR